MKIFYTLLASACLALSSPSQYAQETKTHFDNKDYVKGEMLVQVKSGQSMKSLLQKMPESYNMKVDRILSKPMRVYLVTFDDNVVSHHNLQAQLYKEYEVSLVDYNYKIEMRATVPNDADFSDQWHHVNTGQTGGTPDADIDSDEAWDITTGGTTATNDDIVVCLIESGNLDHTDLTANRWFNANEIPNNNIDDDGNGYIDDYNGWNPVSNNDDYGTGAHGTNCLGMIGAKGNNGSLVAGANWDVKLMVVGDYSINTQALAIEAYTYPLEMRQLWNNTNGAQGAFVVATSSSWGIDGADPSNYPIWCSFYDTLGKYGVLNIGATTNTTFDVDAGGDMPTACNSPYMVGVGRTDHNDNTAGGYGATTIEFGAPGINVVTTAGSSGTTTTTGTSFSCPLTAGVVGLAYSIPCTDFMDIVRNSPQQGADLVLQALLDGTDPKAALASKFVTGGRLNAKNTLDELMAVACSGNLCLAPSSIAYSNVGEVSADISWTPFSSSTSYDLYVKESSATDWDTLHPSGTTYALTGLTPCTEYEFFMQSICGTDSSNNSSTQTFTTSGCGNCIDLSYCNNNATDANDEFISSVVVGSLSNASGNDGGYGDYTNGAASATSYDIGDSYSFTLTPGWSGQQYNEQFKLWIDLDQSGTFDNGELLYDQGSAGTTAVSGTITIPQTATPGSTRMRIQMAYIGQGQTTFPGICNSFTYGEVEDYCVELVPAVICGYNVVNTITEPKCDDLSDGEIAVNVTGATAPYNYDWGSAGGNVSSISNLDAGNYELIITDDVGCDTTINYTLNYTTNIDVSFSNIDVTCNGGNDGETTATATGSTGFSYDWGGGNTGNTQSGLSAGQQVLTVTDADGCAETVATNIQEPSPVSAGFNETQNNLTVNFTNTSTAGTYSWDFDDGNTSSQTNPTHTYNGLGIYNVCLTVTDPNCGTNTTCTDIAVGTSGISDVENSILTIYPIPASSALTIKDIPSSVKELSITDMTGKLITTIVINADRNDIPVQNYANGTYLIQIKNDSGIVISTDRFSVLK